MSDQSTDGGTDKVSVLFPDRPAAVPTPPSPEVVAALEAFSLDAASGKCVGIIILAFDELGNHRTELKGKIPFSHAVTALEQMKFGVLARDYATQLAGATPK